MKKLLIFLPFLVLGLSFYGCSFMDTIFFKTDSVEAKDLSEYEGTTPEDESTTFDLISNAAGEAIFNGIQGIMSKDEWNNFSKMISKNYPGIKALDTKFLSNDSDTSKSITFDGDRNDDDGNVDFTVSIKDESVNGQQSGSITVNNLDLKVKAEIDDIDNPKEGSWNFDINTKTTLDDYSNSSSYTINKGIINLKAKGNGTVNLNSQGDIEKTDYYLAIDLKAGFSISGGEGNSGKFIIEFNYIDSNSITESDLQDPDKLLENMELSIIVKIYNNDNELLHTYTYDQNDLKNDLNEIQS